MQSKMILALCVTLFTMCVLWTMAVPKPRPREAQSAPTAPAAAPAPRRSLPGDHVDGVWSPAGFGLRLDAPPQWRASRTRGRARLACDLADPGRGQFELSARAVLGETDLAARAAALHSVLSSQAGFELLSSRETVIGARKAQRLDYRARGTNGEPLRSTALLWTSGPQELLLVFSAAEKRWAELEAVCAAGLASLDLGPAGR